MTLARLSMLCCCLAATVQCSNILAIVPSRSYSHFIVLEPLLLELANKGHHLTVVSSFPHKSPPSNYHDIDVSPTLPPVQSNLTYHEMINLGRNPFDNMNIIWGIGANMCESILKSGILRDLYNSSTRYDLVITHLHAYECFSVFAHKFDTPLVSVVTSSALPWTNGRVGNPDHPAYVVNNFVNAHEDMTVTQRTLNTLAWLWATVGVHPGAYSRTDLLVRTYLDSEAPPARDIIKRTSLVMVNSHFTMLQSRPFVPNFVEIGGIHIKKPKPLPKDLQRFLDEALHGVIIFSLGSHVRVSSMDKSSLQAFMDAFASLPQRVVFKFEDDIKDAPPNVLVRRWLPQRDMLEHPKVRALMAHGGQSSTMEAVYTGTPMVGMPLFSDQYSNIQTLVLKGAAVLLDLRDLTKEKVLDAIKKVLDNPSYKQNAESLSHQFRDRLASPLDTAVFWTEYVLRHKGAPQLRSKVADLPWYRFFLLDVAAVLLPFIIIAFMFIRTAFKHVCCSISMVAIKKKRSKVD